MNGNRHLFIVDAAHKQKMHWICACISWFDKYYQNKDNGIFCKIDTKMPLKKLFIIKFREVHMKTI